ncbi:MAG: PHP domain-containing protein [Anaerolineales bacterium]|nr:PHP domain-containing protein [Anaerolineales bacterium]
MEDQGKYFHAVGNMHMHTPFSDGEKWHGEIAADAIAAGLDFIIVTDHNIWVDGLEGYYEGENGRLLLLTGEEVHNVRRQPQASHFLVYGAESEMAPCAADPQALIDATCAAGGYGFLAHPHENGLPQLGYPNLGWHDWEIDNFTGLEIWNYMSSFINCLAVEMDKFPLKHPFLLKLLALRVALTPEKYIVGPETATLALWDELLAQGKRVTAVGNSDAHGTPMSLGPIKRIIYPYEFLFRAVNTHLLLKEPLTGDAAHDKKLILTAIGKGHSWVGYDMPHSTKGFRFTGQGINKGRMGDTIKLDAGATLQVSAPTRAHIRIIRHGSVVAEIKNETHLTHIPTEPGAYRVECSIPYEGMERGWIFSNPIYLI